MKNAAALYLLPHQDDEYPIASRIVFDLKRVRVVCIVLTDGSYHKSEAERRNRETLAFLMSIGVDQNDVLFLGHEYAIPDTKLSEHWSLAVTKITEFCARFRILDLYSPAWEGGHPDHDSSALIGHYLAQKVFAIPENYWVYPVYSQLNSLTFVCGRPRPENGTVTTRRIPLKDVKKFAFKFVMYRSQLRTWVILAPFFLVKFLILRVETLQRMAGKRFSERPHSGKLFYEKRWKIPFEKIRGDLGPLIREIER